jgi:diguanylate cyclase (GGDEF)-like protein
MGNMNHRLETDVKSTATIHAISDAVTSGLVMAGDSSLHAESGLDAVANGAYYRVGACGFFPGQDPEDGSIAPNRSAKGEMVRGQTLPPGSMVHAGMASKLAAAEARIALLESALHKVSQLASHDPLTGAFNRRGMNEVFSREVARAQRTCLPLAVALIDLDDFKLVNDRYGHAVGDAALVYLTRAIGETLRPTDTCCRLGGEEFVVIMPGADQVAARQALVRLQAALDGQSIADTSVTLAFSAGVVHARRGESLEDVLARADCAVYRAKAAGKRCIVGG